MAHELKRYCLAFILKNFDQAGFGVNGLGLPSRVSARQFIRVFGEQLVQVRLGIFKGSTMKGSEQF